MSSKPSWLDDEDTSAAAVKVAKNPAAQKVATKVASDPKVQSAVKEATVNAVMASAAPTWAQDTYTPPTVAGEPVADVENQTRTPSTASQHQPEEFVCDPEELKNMQRWHTALRICYMLAAALMAVAAGLSLVNQQNVGLAFFALYVLFFCLVLCCFEVALDGVAKLIAINFGFLYTLAGRLAFILFVGFMSYSLTVFGKVAMGVLYAVFCLHIFMLFKFPKRVQRQQQRQHGLPFNLWKN